MLNSVSPPETPATSGNVARTIGTAPRRPAQPTSVCSRSENRERSRDAYTATGRATSVRNTVVSTATPSTGRIRLGNTSSPSVTNMAICPSQARPSWKRARLRLCR